MATEAAATAATAPVDALRAALKDMAEKSANAALQAKALQERLQSGELSSANGVSFLEAKNHLLLDYNIHLVHLMLLKLQGTETATSPSRERLVYLRAMLDKAKPIDSKLKYQIDKLVKAGVAGTLQALDEDPLLHKPQPLNLVSKTGEADDNNDDNDDDGDGDSKSRSSDAASMLYEPPKLSAVPYFEDDSKAAKAERRQEKEAHKLRKSAMMRELRDEYSDRPVEVRGDDAYVDMVGAPTEHDRDVQKYEEDNFVRLATRKTKRARPNSNTLDDILDFGSSRQLVHEEHTSNKRRKTETMSSKMSKVQRPKMRERSLPTGSGGRKSFGSRK